MTAQSADKARRRFGEHRGDSPSPLGVKAATRIFQGALAVNDAGVMAPGRTAVGLIAMGVARQQYDNTAGAAGAIIGEAEMGDFPFTNSTAGDLIIAADVGKDCYIVDDTTVAKTDGTGTRSRAGKVQQVLTTGEVVVRVGTGD